VAKLTKRWSFASTQKHFQDIEEVVKSNIKNPKMDPKKLVVFPMIEFHEVSGQDLERAQKWKAKNPINQKLIANLSGAQVKEGLRILTPYLLQEKGVEVIDLSHNYLGYSGYGIEAVKDLLKSPGSLKELRLNNNTLRGWGFDPLIDGLEKNTSLEKLILNNNSLFDRHIEKLCDSLKNHKNIKRIELHHNNFNQQGVEHLMKLMRDNPNIQSITTECSSFPWHRVKGLERDAEGNVVYAK
jgi:hypothetical protein